MDKEAEIRVSIGYLRQNEFSLDQLLNQEKYQAGFASYLAEVNQRRASTFSLNELTRDEVGVKLAFALKVNQSELRQSASDYLETRGRLIDQGRDPKYLLLDLAACDLSRANLELVDLRQADLEGANLGWANLELVDLRQADLKWADLKWADLRRADLEGADLRGVRYLDYVLIAFGANFTGARLGQAELQALNRLDQKEENLLEGASGLIRDESGRITGVESLPDPESETEEIKKMPDSENILANFLSAFIALSAEEQETFLDKLRK